MNLLTQDASIKVSNEYLLKALTRDEAMKLTAYRDNSAKRYLTCGIGHNCEAHPTGPLIGKSITQVGDKITVEDAQKLFDYDMTNVIKGLQSKYNFWLYLNAAGQYVMANVEFNMGVGSIRSKWPSFLKIISTGDGEAAATWLSNNRVYRRQVKGRADRMIEVLRSGTLPDIGGTSNSGAGIPISVPQAADKTSTGTTQAAGGTPTGTQKVILPASLESIEGMTIEQRLNLLRGRILEWLT